MKGDKIDPSGNERFEISLPLLIIIDFYIGFTGARKYIYFSSKCQKENTIVIIDTHLLTKWRSVEQNELSFNLFKGIGSNNR